MSKFTLVVIAAASASFLATGGYSLLPRLDAKSAFAPAIGGSSTARCDIKGNVSIDTREKIYHVPGQYYYQDTKISPQHGERWFCSEQEARNAGWRKSRR